MYLLLANGITCFTDHKFLECILFVLIYIICWLNYIFNLLTFTLILLIQAYNQGIYFDGWCLYLRNLFIYYQPVKYWREVACGFCYAEDWYILPSKMHTFRLDLVYSFFFSLSSISLIFLLFPVFFSLSFEFIGFISWWLCLFMPHSNQLYNHQGYRWYAAGYMVLKFFPWNFNDIMTFHKKVSGVC